jgi:hypothetical protein
MRRLVAALLVATGLGAATEAAPLYFAGEVAGVGDPNPFFENGTYSVFYLQNQGRHPWFMSQTSDLRTWSGPVEAVPVGEAGAPDYWTGSGSVVADPEGGHRLYYTGPAPRRWRVRGQRSPRPPLPASHPMTNGTSAIRSCSGTPRPMPGGC